jgi:hypothetical protein
MKTNRATQARRSPFEARVVFAQVVTGIGAVGFGTLAVGAVAIGASAIRKLAIRRGRIGRLEIGRPRVRDLVVEQEQTPRRGARHGSVDKPAAHPEQSQMPLGVKEVEQGRQEALYEKTA